MQKANLCLHAGAAAVSREEVYSSKTPCATDTWHPIAHGTLLDHVQNTLGNAGLHVVTEAHALHKDGDRYFGLLQVANGENHDDYGLIIGLRNSHDKSFPAELVLGSQVFVCDNLAFSGQIRLARKHTVNIERDLPQLVHRAVGLVSELKNSQAKRITAYKEHELTNTQAHDLVIQAVDTQVLPVTKVPYALKEWRTPQHDAFKPRTAWSFFNALTEVLKQNINELPKRTVALHGLMDTACGLVVPQGYKSTDAEIVLANAG